MEIDETAPVKKNIKDISSILAKMNSSPERFNFKCLYFSHTILKMIEIKNEVNQLNQQLANVPPSNKTSYAYQAIANISENKKKKIDELSEITGVKFFDVPTMEELELAMAKAETQELDRKQEHPFDNMPDIKTVGKYTAAVVGGGTLAVGGAILVLPALGFTAAGVTAGSIAAGVQSSIGCVAAGSTFALLQSAGAAGMAVGTKAAISSVGSMAAVAALPHLPNNPLNNMPGLGSLGRYATVVGDGAVAVGRGTLALPAIGYKAGSVAVSSIAAGVQSSIDCAAARSSFAAYQSAGTAGMALLTKAAISSAGSMATVAAAIWKKK